MITNVSFNSNIYGKSEAPTFFGLSTDTKPTDCLNASLFYEMDTKKIYLFDAEGSQWLEQ